MIKGVNTIDLHAHILPCADHGSSGPEMTARQLALLNNMGVDTVVATPHFYPNRHTVDYFEDKLTVSTRAILDMDIPRPRICLGAEVLYYNDMDKMEDLQKLCIRGTDILLLELPFHQWDVTLFDTVKRMAAKQTVILAHIDRYICDRQSEIDALLDFGTLAQINTSSLFSFSTKRKIMRYVEDGKVFALGSDLHETDKRVCKQFADAHKKLGDHYEEIMKRSEELLKNAERI